jgi:hypothetical protein
MKCSLQKPNKDLITLQGNDGAELPDPQPGSRVFSEIISISAKEMNNSKLIVIEAPAVPGELRWKPLKMMSKNAFAIIFWIESSA